MRLREREARKTVAVRMRKDWGNCRERRAGTWGRCGGEARGCSGWLRGPEVRRGLEEGRKSLGQIIQEH